MISYELAKELKDAGFPQEWREGMAFYRDSARLCEAGCSDYNDNLDAAKGCKVPLLAELIAACSTSFHTLGRSDAKWWAAEFKEPFADTFPSRCDGSSPEEASPAFGSQ